MGNHLPSITKPEKRRSKREIIADFLDKIGISYLPGFGFQRAGLHILNYHRFVDPDDCAHDRHFISAAPEEVFLQLKYLFIEEIAESCFYCEVKNVS